MKRVAVIDDTGEQHQVFTSLSDFDERLYPTMFFSYFSDAPVFNVMTQCLDILDLKKFIIEDTEEDNVEETKEG